MALATKCPHCNTIFRVAADQLKLRGGIVRCGACKEVFDGNAALVDTAAPAAAAPALPNPAPPAPAAAPEAPAPAQTDFSLDFDTSPDSFGLPPPALPEVKATAPALPEQAAPPALPEKAVQPALPTSAPDLELDFEIDFELDAADVDAEQPAPAPAAAPHDGRHEPRFDFEPEEHIVAAALPEHDAMQPPAPAADQDDEAEPAPAEAEAQAEAQAEDEARDDAEDEPGFVRQGRRRERLGRRTRIGMAVGSVLLLAALLAQGLTTFRNQLAANLPQVKPLLVSACSLFGCRVEVPAQIEALSIEQGELQTLAENTFSYASILHNQSASAQAWPSIELTLNDAADKPVLRRVLSPRDYLAPTVDLSKGFAPHSEQAVKLYFELAQLKASGYHIAIFYP